MKHMDYYLADFLLQVRWIMRHSDTKQKELANRLGISRPGLTQLISGRQNLTIKTMASIADSLGYRLEINLRKPL